MSDFNLFDPVTPKPKAVRIKLGHPYEFQGRDGIVVRKRNNTFRFLIGKHTTKLRYDGSEAASFEPLTDQDSLLDIYKRARRTYELGKPLMSDKAYDKFEDYFKNIYPNNSVFKEVGAPIPDSQDKVKLAAVLGSQNKIKPGNGTVPKWLKKYPDRTVVLSNKLDGLSLLLKYENGDLVQSCTRGNGYEGQDVTSKMAFVNVKRKIACTDTILVRCEAVMAVATFKAKYTKKNPRNMVSGAFNKKELVKKYRDMLRDVDVIAYEIMESDLSKIQQLRELKNQGFAVVEYLIGNTSDLTEKNLEKSLINSKDISRYEMDGYVIDLNSIRLRKRLGFETNSINPKYARAFKIDDGEEVKTTVTHIEWNVSKHSYLKPKLNVAPVDIGGVTVSNVTAHNAAYIKEHNIGVGSEITIIRSGDVIPYIKSIVKATSADLPTTCPECGADVEWNDPAKEVDIKCTGDDCSGSGLKKAEFFFKALGVENFSGGRIKQFWEAGYASIDSILRMTKDDMLALDGIKKRMATKIFDGIHDAAEGCYWPDLAHASGLFGRALGSTKLEQLYNKYKGDFSAFSSLLPMEHMRVVKRIERVQGFSTKTAEMFAKGLKPFCDWLESVKDCVTVADYEVPSLAGSKLTGQNIVFTGFRDKELQETVEKNGGKIGSGVSGKTTILVCKDPSKSGGKLDKARAAGVKLMSGEEFKTYLEDTL